MQIIVNGDTHTLERAPTVAELLTHLAIAAGRVAVEINEQVVPRDGYATHRIASGDRIEIVQFVGGG